MPLQRIVCFKFKETATGEEKQRHMSDFKSLKDNISQILSYAAGKALPESNDELPDYDVMHYLTFATEKDLAEYNIHEEHQNFIRKNKPIWEKVLVISSTIDG